jgi:hypothetical protein
MRSATRTIDIDAPASDVFAFVADVAKLPIWAIGFAKAVDEDGGTWRVTTGSGERIEIVVRADAATGVVDYAMRPAPGVELLANTRVVPRGEAAVYAFTLFEDARMASGVFEEQVRELERELTVLKAHVESACPV